MIPKKSKFGNKKVVVDDYKFDSKAEAAYYVMLRDRGYSFMPIAGKYVAMQKFIPIQSAVTLKNGEKIQAVRYKADFVFYDGLNIEKVVDVKGYQDSESKLKMKMFAKEYGYPVTFAKYDHRKGTFEEMSCFESLRRQNQRAKERREKKAVQNEEIAQNNDELDVLNQETANSSKDSQNATDEISEPNKETEEIKEEESVKEAEVESPEVDLGEDDPY